LKKWAGALPFFKMSFIFKQQHIACYGAASANILYRILVLSSYEVVT
jgi:hypothetical protein